MMNPVAYVYREIQKYLLGDVDKLLALQKGQALIRVHNNKLADCGDLSFSGKPVAWENSIGRHTGFHKELPSSEAELQEFLSDFLEKAKNWEFPILKFERKASRFSLFFNRDVVIQKVLQMVLREEDNGLKLYGRLRKNAERRVYRLTSRFDERNLTFYRANLIGKVLDNVLEYSEWNIVNNVADVMDDVLQVQVLSVAAQNSPEFEISSNGYVNVLVGIVVDPITGKLTSIETGEYMKQRTNDLNLVAMHKYGIRPKDDKAFDELMSRLGTAAVTVDMLEKKCSSPATIIRNGLGSNTKGACFILYNSARLETLLKTFEGRVQDGTYGSLPPVDQVDFALLNNEEEWQLIFVYIFGFPDLIERCLRQLENGQFAPHLIIQFLSGFVGVFSVYYRRIRILTECRPQLMPQLYARIYLLKALRDVFNKTLALLDIEPVAHM